MPKKVEELVKRVKNDNPSYDDAKAYATAWSIFCKHVSPDHDSCKRDPEGYLKEKKARQQRIATRLAFRFLVV